MQSESSPDTEHTTVVHIRSLSLGQIVRGASECGEEEGASAHALDYRELTGYQQTLAKTPCFMNRLCPVPINVNQSIDECQLN
jgi:hypothetical protein